MSNDYYEHDEHGEVRGGAMELATQTALVESSSALAQQAVAMVQARYVMALKKPRDMDQVRQDLLKECRRPVFARVARYHKPIGKGVEGPSIRFAETAVRCMRNLIVDTIVISNTRTERVIRVVVSDLETNATYTKDICVEKTVERSSPKDGQEILSQRKNSRGNWTFTVAASEDDLLNKEAALISKATRTCVLRLIPGDLMDEAMWQVQETLRNAAAKDPDGERKSIIDAFSGLNVRAEELNAYLGHPIATASPEEIVHLRAVFATVKEGACTWKDALDASPYVEKKDDEKASPRATAASQKVRANLEKMRKSKEAPKTNAAPPKTNAPATNEPAPPAENQEPKKPAREPGED